MNRFYGILWTVVGTLAALALGITNEAGHFSPDQFADLSQFQTFPRHLVRNPLSPVQQNQILRDVQQHHRFQFQQPQPQPLPAQGNAANPLYQQHQFTSSAEQNQPVQQFNNGQNNYHRPLQPNHQPQQAFIPQYHHQAQQQQQHLQQNQQLPQQSQQQVHQPYRSIINSPVATQSSDSSGPKVRINYSPQSSFPQQGIVNQALHASAEQTDFHTNFAETGQSDYIPKIDNQQPSKKFISSQSSNRFFIPDRPDQQVRYVQPQFTSFDNQVPTSTGEGSTKLKPFLPLPNEKPQPQPTINQHTERSQSVVHNNVVLDRQPKIQYVYQSTTSNPTTEAPTQKYYIKQVHKNGLRQQSTKSTSTKRIPEASTFSPIYASPSSTSASSPVVTIGHRTRATAATAAPTEKSVRVRTEPIDRQRLIEQLINSQQIQSIAKPSDDEDDLASIHAQVLKKDNLLKGLQGGTVITSDQLSSLPDIQKLIAGNNASSSLFLGNGQQVKIIQIPDKSKGGKSYADIKGSLANRPPTTTSTTTAKPPKVLFEELTRGVLPPGADFEVIRQKQDGELEEVGKIPPNLQKKVTFVILEEHPDGTVKVQGVRGNENSKSKDEDVDSIIKKLQEGEIKLPPSTKISHANSRHISSNSATQESVQTPAYVRHDSVKAHPTPDVRVSGDGSSGSTLKYSPTTTLQSTTPAADIVRQYTPTTIHQHDKHYFSTVSSFPNAHARPTLPSSSVEDTVLQHTPSPRPASRPSSPAFLPTPPASLDDDPSIGINSVAASPSTVFLSKPTRITHRFSTSTSTSTTPSPSSFISSTDRTSLPDDDLVEILKRNGLYAMARYLKQSGLDSVLNETGPYTLFVPTDRAFRALQVQLGGPDKAEEKFKENPRLLSGLLLHHVVPGVFTAESLQDEMTGVSLAGTQLRVNTYTTQDIEWNDIKVRTVNGARLMADKQNVMLRQGYAHAVDRVLFPLPVGDLLQTLRSDRDARFTHFLAALARSGVANMLTGLKTYTVFAPVDSAFKTEDLQRIESEGAAKRFVLRHLTPGTLYSAGMRYYQLRDSMDKSTHLTLYKEAGNVKVNSAHVLTRNIPATNGVIHAIDALL